MGFHAKSLYSSCSSRHIYYEASAITGDNVMQLLYSAKKYMLPTLEAECQAFLQKEMNPNNVWPILEQVFTCEISMYRY